MVRWDWNEKGAGWLPGLPLVMILALLGGPAVAGKPKLAIGKVVLSAHGLTVKGSYRNGSASSVDLYDSSGRLLGSPALDGKHRFRLTIEHPPQPELLCTVQAKADGAIASKPVAGRSRNCGKMPLCRIRSPSGLYTTGIDTDASFEGKAVLRDRKAGPLRIEWDFAGGVMGEPVPGTHPQAYKRPDTEQTTVRFVRDNAYYRVRFTAWDKLTRYCEDSVLVKVGNPPADLPDVSGLVSAARQGAPAAGSQLAGAKNEVVVLPYADLTLPGTGDYRYTPFTEIVTAYTAFSTLNAIAYKKDRLPVVLDGNGAALKYSAASNPDDPVGAGSINTTSQNWPLNADISQPAPLQGAAIQKTDRWELVDRPLEERNPDFYVNQNWVSQIPHSRGRHVGPDEGYVLAPLPGQYEVAGDAKGRYMPGRSAPYSSNGPQEFTAFDPAEQRHIARAIPLTDIDDSGRVNPFPLLRVEAEEQATGETAAADAVVGTAKDVHCRECHAKGKIAANDQFDWDSIQQAFHSSKFYGENPSKLANGCWYAAPYCTTAYSPPIFFESLDRNGQPSGNLFDQEFAANLNISALHDFYDWTEEVASRNGSPTADGKGYQWDAPLPCSNCHRSRISAEVGDPWVWTFTGFRGAGQPTDSVGTLSEVIHNFHEELQLDPADPNKILRDSRGRPKLWDPATGPNPNTPFPTVQDGQALPMERNCLRCHGGHREPLYRDRMYTAGVTCYDCHGDMRAVGSAFVKSKPGTGGDIRRLGWYEQPDCGSCHTGDANRGKDGTGGYYSAGVMKRAFDDGDRTAAPRPPLTGRFAVQLGNPVVMPGIETDVMEDEYRYRDKPYIRTIQVPLFRNSRDSHGNVPCAACHGGAHENWPNRDPKANDNVTAVQLQGHTGHILECNVCHTADSFKELQDLDGGKYMTEVAQMTGFAGGGSGVLGGPHNLHPIADENWWKEAKGNLANADSTGDSGSYGGWHNDLAKQPGKDGEDQCAACHGNDHRGSRLSKTPVDRVFDFSGLNFKQLRKAGVRKKVIKVAAGTEIGCDTCHSIKTSCIGSPAGGNCGKPSDAITEVPVNRDPVISSVPGVTEAIMDEAYNYQVVATDPDGDPLNYRLGYRPANPDNMTVSESGLVTYQWPETAFASSPHGPFVFPYTVTVSDGKGGYTTQTVTMTLRCPDGKSWVWDGAAYAGSCVADSSGAAIVSVPPAAGMNAGETYSYDVEATSGKGLPLAFSLQGAPAGMTIDAASGTIAWTAPDGGGDYAFTVKAEDGGGGVAYQTVKLAVCPAGKTWHSDHGMCM